MSKRHSTRKGSTHLAHATTSDAWDSDDPEIRALNRNAAFRALLRGTAERAEHEGTISLEEMSAFRDLTPGDDIEGERLLTELEGETEEKAAALTEPGRNGLAARSG